MRLSLILPTYNEAENLPELLRRVHEYARPFEVIVVDDDSPDKTWEIAESLKGQYPHLRLMRRIGKRGLSSAVVDGCDVAKGDMFVVMDSDLQHDPSLVAQLGKKIEEGADIAVASRYCKGGGVEGWKRGRRLLSTLGTFLARRLPNVKTTDPMSGFYAVRSTVWEKARPSIVPEGFKILLELLSVVPRGTRLSEVPMQFRPRLHGKSKLSFWVQMQFLEQVKRIGMRKIGLSGKRIFALIVLVLALVFAWRIVEVSALYMYPTMARELPARLTAVARARGWLMSDIEIDWFHDDGSARLRYVKHRRGADAEECWFLQPAPFTTLDECVF